VVPSVGFSIIALPTHFAHIIFQFFENVLTDCMQAFLHSKKTTCFMLACGALVKYKEPQAGLLEVFQS
jgi:NADPH-dependent curcumin reductase CurA